MSKAKRRRRVEGVSALDEVVDEWEIVAELSAPNGNNDAVWRRVMADHPELRALPERDVRIDLLCGRSDSSVRVLRRVTFIAGPVRGHRT